MVYETIYLLFFILNFTRTWFGLSLLQIYINGEASVLYCLIFYNVSNYIEGINHKSVIMSRQVAVPGHSFAKRLNLHLANLISLYHILLYLVMDL